MLIDRSIYLEASTIAADGGELVGKDPRKISASDMASLGGPQSRAKAIRAKCLDCNGGNEAETRKCVSISCALWPFRMGRNPFHSKSASSRLDAMEDDDA